MLKLFISYVKVYVLINVSVLSNIVHWNLRVLLVMKCKANIYIVACEKKCFLHWPKFCKNVTCLKKCITSKSFNTSVLNGVIYTMESNAYKNYCANELYMNSAVYTHGRRNTFSCGRRWKLPSLFIAGRE
jgi:hypothetical protein